MTLRVWRSDTDWVIAESAQRAHEIAHESCGAKFGELGEVEDWEALPDDESIRVIDERPAETVEVTRTAAEWIAHEGKEGFLCSTEW